MKLKLLLIAIIAFIFSGCYTSTAFKSNETYAQSYHDVNIYIDYEFDCGFCYYEMYWCFNCQTYHVHVNRWCHNHYYWYTSWYNVNYYQPYAYYHGHYNNHVYYRDVTRHYIRDNNGLRNTRGAVNKVFGTKEYNNNRNNDIIKRDVPKKYDTNLKQRYNETYKKQNDVKRENKTYQKPNNTQRENKTYQKPNNTQRQNTQKAPVQKNSGSKTMKKR